MEIEINRAPKSFISLFSRKLFSLKRKNIISEIKYKA